MRAVLAGVVLAPRARMNLARATVAVTSMSCSLAMACTRPSATADVDAAVHGHDAPSGLSDAPALAVDAPALANDAAAACKPANILHGDGHHNAGQDCMGGCHDHGFSVAGTLDLADGVTPANNATVTIVDANHGTQDLIVGTNGNFFSFFPVTYPITITASLCPDTRTMISHPTAGACNAAGCHQAGGVQGPARL